MRMILGGVRGSAPVTRQTFLTYGGDTTSLLIVGAAGERLLLDGGTGLRNLLPHLGAEALLLLLTHYHLDHLLGLPNFAPLYARGRRIEIAAPPREGVTAADALGRLLAAPFWPVPLAEMGADVRFTDLPATPPAAGWRHGGLEIRWCGVPHRHGCHAYRIDEPASGAALVFATDLEWRAASAAEREALLRLCREPSPGALLIMDGQFCAANQAAFRGWGHSTWEEAVALARQAGVGRLLVTHHAPGSDDARLAEVEQAVTAAWSGAQLARQGMIIEVEGGRR